MIELKDLQIQGNPLLVEMEGNKVNVAFRFRLRSGNTPVIQAGFNIPVEHKSIKNLFSHGEFGLYYYRPIYSSSILEEAAQEFLNANQGRRGNLQRMAAIEKAKLMGGLTPVSAGVVLKDCLQSRLNGIQKWSRKPDKDSVSRELDRGVRDFLAICEKLRSPNDLFFLKEEIQLPAHRITHERWLKEVDPLIYSELARQGIDARITNKAFGDSKCIVATLRRDSEGNVTIHGAAKAISYFMPAERAGNRRRTALEIRNRKVRRFKQVEEWPVMNGPKIENHAQCLKEMKYGLFIFSDIEGTASPKDSEEGFIVPDPDQRSGKGDQEFLVPDQWVILPHGRERFKAETSATREYSVSEFLENRTMISERGGNIILEDNSRTVVQDDDSWWNNIKDHISKQEVTLLGKRIGEKRFVKISYPLDEYPDFGKMTSNGGLKGVGIPVTEQLYIMDPTQDAMIPADGVLSEQSVINKKITGSVLLTGAAAWKGYIESRGGELVPEIIPEHLAQDIIIHPNRQKMVEDWISDAKKDQFLPAPDGHFHDLVEIYREYFKEKGIPDLIFDVCVVCKPGEEIDFFLPVHTLQGEKIGEAMPFRKLFRAFCAPQGIRMMIQTQEYASTVGPMDGHQGGDPDDYQVERGRIKVGILESLLSGFKFHPSKKSCGLVQKYFHNFCAAQDILTRWMGNQQEEYYPPSEWDGYDY
jgi:hypothetical protein